MKNNSSTLRTVTVKLSQQEHPAWKMKYFYTSALTESCFSVTKTSGHTKKHLVHNRNTGQYSQRAQHRWWGQVLQASCHSWAWSARSPASTACPGWWWGSGLCSSSGGSVSYPPYRSTQDGWSETRRIRSTAVSVCEETFSVGWLPLCDHSISLRRNI